MRLVASFEANNGCGNVKTLGASYVVEHRFGLSTQTLAGYGRSLGAPALKTRSAAANKMKPNRKLSEKCQSEEKRHAIVQNSGCP
jgi:hypothetical protein